MPMSADVLGPMIQTAIDSLTDEQKKDRAQLFKAFAAAVIAHIQTAAVVEVASVSGVTTGTGVSGPGVGAIT